MSKFNLFTDNRILRDDQWKGLWILKFPVEFVYDQHDFISSLETKDFEIRECDGKIIKYGGSNFPYSYFIVRSQPEINILNCDVIIRIHHDINTSARYNCEVYETGRFSEMYDYAALRIKR